MTELVILLEEPSAREMLNGILPKIIPNTASFVRYIVFQGKQDLEKNVTRKLQRYLNANAVFLIVRDQDSGDCKAVKENLLQKCKNSGRQRYLVRILCHELETVYLADLAAVEKGLGVKNLAKHQNKQLYRKPDLHCSNPKNVLKSIAPEYQEISGSAAIAPHLQLENIRSDSFKNLIAGIKKLLPAVL